MSEVHSNNSEVQNKTDTSNNNDVDPNKRIDTSKKSSENHDSDVNPNKRVSDVSDTNTHNNTSDDVDPNKRVGENKESDKQKDNSENDKSYPPNSTVEIGGKICKTDDNGKVYSEDGKPLPNCEYVLNGFKYKTDSSGRIINAQGDVKIPTTEREQNPEIKNKDKRETDDKGHVIGHQLGGKEDEGNLVPQDRNLNRGEYNKLEKYLAKLKSEGHDVKIEVTVKYKGDSDRPDSFRVKYTVDGKTYFVTFKNEAQQNGGK